MDKRNLYELLKNGEIYPRVYDDVMGMEAADVKEAVAAYLWEREINMLQQEQNAHSAKKMLMDGGDNDGTEK